MIKQLTCKINSFHPFFQRYGYYWVLIGRLAEELVKHLPDANIEISLKNDTILIATITSQEPVERAIQAFNFFLNVWGNKHLTYANFVIVLAYGDLRIVRDCDLTPLINFCKFD